MIRKNLIKVVLSISLLLLLILSCDERTPVTSPPIELNYTLTLTLDNTSCTPHFDIMQGDFCDDGTECDSSEEIACNDGSECIDDECDDLSVCSLACDDGSGCSAIDNSENFTESNLTTKRPGKGISPMKWNQIIGKKAKKNYKRDDFI